MPRMSKLPFGTVLLLWATLAVGQNNLGEILNAGASRLSAEAFRQEVVGRTVVGPIAGFKQLEVVYTADGRVLGIGTPNRAWLHPTEITGTWTTGDGDTICIIMYLGTVSFAKRCQFWLKLGEEYFISDSDSDHSMRVLRRTVTQ